MSPPSLLKTQLYITIHCTLLRLHMKCILPSRETLLFFRELAFLETQLFIYLSRETCTMDNPLGSSPMILVTPAVPVWRRERGVWKEDEPSSGGLFILTGQTSTNQRRVFCPDQDGP